MQTMERSLPEPSLMGWARTARPVRLVWPLRHETASPRGAGAVRDLAVEPDREPRLDDALFGSASLALAAIVVVAALVV